MKRLFFCLPMIGLLSANVSLASLSFQSGVAQTGLLELYTSEGCSSCPPAEKWLGQLQESPGLWRDFVPVAFHVDYWDYLGWRDPWSAHEYSLRQQLYSQNWQSARVYTPECVLNGKEWRDWPVQNNGPQLSGAVAGVLTVTSPDTHRWQVTFAPTNAAGANYEVCAALLAGGLTSNVKAGENRGRRLNHDFVVLKLLTRPLVTTNGIAQGEFVLSSERAKGGRDLALAVWVTRSGELEPLQATGGWLEHHAAARANP